MSIKHDDTWMRRVILSVLGCAGVLADGLTAEPMRIEIDARATGAVISPLLFGHNLEVTRRAIWSGLGAEMVANRKFAAVDKGLAKRWQATDATVKAAVDDKVAYGGKHSLRLETAQGSHGGGVWQREEGLTFHQGTRYAYRWHFKTEVPRKVMLRITGGDGAPLLAQAEKSLDGGDWQVWAGDFVASADAANARLEITSETPGVWWIGAASVQPADNFHGMRRDVIALLKQLQPGALRFPGGCYSEFYRWQDGLLPVDQRPPIGPTGLDFLLRNSDDVDTQELGIDEFIALCRELSCEPALTIRLSETSPDDAASWVEYCNGSADTKWGKVRAERGHREPYGVKTWFLGNELYYFGRGGMNNPANCARQSKLFAEAVRKVDPSVRLVACTNLVNGGNNPGWNTPLLEQTRALINNVSRHDYVQDAAKPRDLPGFAKAATGYLRPTFQKFHRDLNLPIVFDEWNTNWGQTGSVGMAFYAAGVLNLLSREAESLGVEQAFYFQPVTEGAIKVTPTGAELDTVGKVFAAFKVHQNNRALKVPETPADADVDLSASVRNDNRGVCVTIVNRSATAGHALNLAVKNLGGSLQGKVRLLVPKSVQPSETVLDERDEPVTINGDKLSFNLPCASVAVVEVTTK